MGQGELSAGDLSDGCHPVPPVLLGRSQGRQNPPMPGDGASRRRRKALRGGVCELKFLL